MQRLVERSGCIEVYRGKRKPYSESEAPGMPIPLQFGFYAILTDPVLGYERCTKILVDTGVAFVQLRIKGKAPSDILPIALMMRKTTLGGNTRLIINDSPDIAWACGADGVHLGQDDMRYDDARRIVGPEAIIGLSTHSLQQTENACSLAPDYIGVGPVFPTPTKATPDPVIGIDGMKTMLAAATVPAAAIGGIDLTNLRRVLDAGAKNFCMVRQFTQSRTPEKVIDELRRVYGEYYPGVW
ncbi:MAG: thiamine phosphate synthase [Chitinispirillaceae bacterium]|nr:thiamine phosphate synthase [Chitinispirillaceae bacterium]